jgi:hypothetical protein
MFMIGEGGTSGAALVEFTIFAPLFVVASIYTADFGLYYYSQMKVQNAAQAGAQYAIVNGFFPQSFSSINGITITNQDCPGGLGLCYNYYCPSSLTTPVALDTPCSDGSTAGKYITIHAQATYNTFVRYWLFPNATYPLAGSAMVRVQ